MKTLYFEGAGWSKADSSMETIGNCRVRTAFHLDNGKPVYLEMLCGSPLKSKNGNVYLTGISHLYYITDDEHNDDCNLHPHPYFIKYIRREVPDFEYSSEAILKFVNSLGCSFDEIKVVSDLGGYRVFKENMYSYKKGTERYNYGDEFVFEPDLHDRRMKVLEYIYALEKMVENGADLNYDFSEYNAVPLLHYTINYKQYIRNEDYKELIAFLILNKIDINKKNSDGQTPLMTALKNGDIDTFNALIAGGADVTLKDNNDIKATVQDVVANPKNIQYL